MRIAIFENIMTPGGHEVDFDRILVDELKKLGHEVVLYVPEGFRFGMDYHVPVEYLPGAPVLYTNARGLRKMLLSVQRERRRFGWYRALSEAAERGAFDALIVPTSTYRYLRALRQSVLRRSPVPVIFIQHGINPSEAPKFLNAVDALATHPNIRPVVLTFGDTVFGEKRKNIRLIPPPTFVPRDIEAVPRPTNLSPSASSGSSGGKSGLRICSASISRGIIRVPCVSSYKARRCTPRMRRSSSASLRHTRAGGLPSCIAG